MAASVELLAPPKNGDISDELSLVGNSQSEGEISRTKLKFPLRLLSLFYRFA